MSAPSNHTWKNSLSFVLATGLISLAIGFFTGQNFEFGHTPETEHERTACEDEHASPCRDVHDAPAGEHDLEHDHEHEHPAVPADLNELHDMQCEHSIGIIECDECRYEAGVVKLDSDAAGALIKTAVVNRAPLASELRLTGQIAFDATHTVDVVIPAGGRVLDVLKKPGDRVRKGDPLAILHSPEFGRLKAEYLDIQAGIELAQATFAREQDLIDKNMTSRADYLQAANALKSAQASQAACDKRLRLFGLSSRQIQAIRNEKTNGEFASLRILAPQDGTIITQDLSRGRLTRSGDTLFTISDLSVLWVWCDVYERHLSALQDRFSAGKPIGVSLRTNAFADAFGGTVDLIGHVMDERTRTVKMRIQVNNPDGRLRPGMFADVQVNLAGPNEVLSVPQSAVLDDEDAHFVFQNWKDNLWVRRDVALGTRFGDRIEILSGLEPGSEIVTSGGFMFKSDILREKMGAGCAD